MAETLAEMHARHAREIEAIERPGAPTYSQLAAEVEKLRELDRLATLALLGAGRAVGELMARAKAAEARADEASREFTLLKEGAGVDELLGAELVRQRDAAHRELKAIKAGLAKADTAASPSCARCGEAQSHHVHDLEHIVTPHPFQAATLPAKRGFDDCPSCHGEGPFWRWDGRGYCTTCEGRATSSAEEGK